MAQTASVSATETGSIATVSATASENYIDIDGGTITELWVRADNGTCKFGYTTGTVVCPLDSDVYTNVWSRSGPQPSVFRVHFTDSAAAAEIFFRTVE